MSRNICIKCCCPQIMMAYPQSIALHPQFFSSKYFFLHPPTLNLLDSTSFLHLQLFFLHPQSCFQLFPGLGHQLFWLFKLRALAHSCNPATWKFRVKKKFSDGLTLSYADSQCSTLNSFITLPQPKPIVQKNLLLGKEKEYRSFQAPVPIPLKGIGIIPLLWFLWKERNISIYRNFNRIRNFLGDQNYF